MVTIGFSASENTTTESNTSVCVTIHNGQLGPNVTVTYTVMTFNDTARGERLNNSTNGCVESVREGWKVGEKLGGREER